MFLITIYEDPGHTVHATHQSRLPTPRGSLASQLHRYLNAGFVGELEIHLRQTAHYHRVFFFFKIKLTYYLIAPKTTKKNKMAIKLRA